MDKDEKKVDGVETGGADDIVEIVIDDDEPVPHEAVTSKEETAGTGKTAASEEETAGTGKTAASEKENSETGAAKTPDDKKSGDDTDPEPPDKKRKKDNLSADTWWRRLPTGVKVLLIAGLVVVVLALAGFIAIKVYLGRVKRIEERPPVAREEETFEQSPDASEDTIDPDEVDWNNLYENVKQDKQIKNIILIGQDRRPTETEPARSDSMILCSINKKTNKITLVSFMRDMYVPIEGYSDNRINAAYNYGGASLLKSTIEKDFGIAIDNAMEVDFDGFIQAMSVVGDLEMELTKEEVEYLNKTGPIMNHEAGLDDGEWNLVEGKNMLKPYQALAYSRTRYVGRSDWDRTERQRKVLTAAFNKISKLGISEQLDLVDELLPYIATDMTDMEILGYAYYVAVEGIHIGETYRLPADGKYTNETINGMSVLVPNLNENSNLLKTYLYGE